MTNPREILSLTSLVPLNDGNCKPYTPQELRGLANQITADCKICGVPTLYNLNTSNTMEGVAFYDCGRCGDTIGRSVKKLDLSQMAKLPRGKEKVQREDDPNKILRLSSIKIGFTEERTFSQLGGMLGKAEINYRCGAIGLINEPGCQISEFYNIPKSFLERLIKRKLVAG